MLIGDLDSPMTQAEDTDPRLQRQFMRRTVHWRTERALPGDRAVTSTPGDPPIDRVPAGDLAADEHSARVERITRGADLAPVAELLTEHRSEILGRWLEVTSRQPFHRNRRDRAVADHLPHLVDGLLAVLRRTAPRDAVYEAPLDDDTVLEAARQHAFVRFEQGLGAADIVTEFRLLRHEISRAMRRYLDSSESPGDIVAAELVVNDALDGATALSMSALSDRVEEVRSDFLATTLHDAGQPVATAKLSIQLAEQSLRRPEPDVARALDAFRRADRSLDRMTVLLRRLADASRLALGAIELRHAETGLGQVARRVVEDLDPETARRITVTGDDDDSGLWDSAALEQVMANLLANAVKFSPPDSPIDVQIVGRPDEVELAVRDRGTGLAAEEFETVFRRFGRSKEARAKGVEGHGLGLYLSRGIVEAHGGSISVESAGHGKGSVFRVVLPRHPVPPEADQFESQ
jgi:signal transduction histidine kinase